jgi:DNA invertase Pin-like site-specific DNA recombinase
MTTLSHPSAGVAAERRITRRKAASTPTAQVLGYGRVSTSDQHPEVQGSALEAAGCSQIFLEVISSRKACRPQLEAALAALRPGDTLVTVRLDRLARNLRELLEIVHQLEQRGIHLLVLAQGIDTSTPTGRLMVSLLGSIGEFERDLGAERLAESIRHRRATGGDLGGRRPSWNEHQHRLGLQLKQEGLSVRVIAERLNLKKSAVGRMLALPLGTAPLSEPPLD